jgi:hypothetical protein
MSESLLVDFSDVAIWCAALASFPNGQLHHDACEIVQGLVQQQQFETLEQLKARGIRNRWLVLLWKDAGSIEAFKRQVSKL